MKILSYKEVINSGIEFTGDVCFSGEYGQQVYTSEMEDGGIPVNGILYELYPNGKLNYYAFYENGIPNGERVNFYDSGELKSYCIMEEGTIRGEHTEWYQNGTIKLQENCRYGFILNRKEFDDNGNIVYEKEVLTESEKEAYEKRVQYYEGK